MKRKQLGSLLFLLFMVGCASAQESNIKSINRPNASPKSVDRIRNDSQKTDLNEQIERIAENSGGRVGVAAAILETGETVFSNSRDRFPMQSVYKLPIGMAVLSQVDAGKIKLNQKLRIEKADILKTSRILTVENYRNGTEQTIEELLRLMVSESDNTASDALLKLVGGPDSVMQFLNKNRISGIEVANYEKEFAGNSKVQYNNWATPEAAVELLRALHEARGLSQRSRSLLLKFMTDSPTGPRRLKWLLTKDAIVAHKTGTSGTKNGLTAATNDIGIITLPSGRHLAIAVFVSDSRADEAAREETIAKIARAVWDHWSNK
ncbi:MAG: class A beta-lactamase [Acidobacteriota bacterium]|nr:class A beta-lactamase [Acidobacteriota bacterium]